jgi:type II secretory pathway pseudopilin PulG
MAIVLIIIGIISAGAIKMIGSGFDNSKFTTTRNNILAIVKSIGEYSAKAQRIPSDITELEETVGTVNDAFGNAVRYVPASELTETSATGICSRTSTSLTLKTCSDASCTSSNDINNVAFVVLSGSINENMQHTESLVDGELTFSTYESGVVVDGYPSDKNKLEKNDDIVGWLTLGALQGAAGCDGKIISIIENRIPDAYKESVYSFELNAKGGVKPYKWCVESDEEKVRDQFRYGSEDVVEDVVEDCDGATKDNSDVLSINTEGTPITDDLPQSSILTVYLEDSIGQTTQKDFVLIYKTEEDLVLDGDDSGGGNNNGGGGSGEVFGDISNFGDMVVADGSDYLLNNSSMANLQDDMLNFNDDDNILGSVCVWSKTTYNFESGKMAVYFEYTPDRVTGNSLHGFNFAIINGEINDENVCGDIGAGLGYADELILNHPIPGENFALEFDIVRQRYKNDPPQDHMGIVSSWRGESYNVHDSGHNDECTSSTGNGCWRNNQVYVSNKTNATRLEAYSGCYYDEESGDLLCNDESNGELVCVYAWNSRINNADENADDITQFYRDEDNTLELRTPDAFDCYPVSDTYGGVSPVRYGFTSSARWNKFDLDIFNFKMRIQGY